MAKGGLVGSVPKDPGEDRGDTSQLWGVPCRIREGGSKLCECHL